MKEAVKRSSELIVFKNKDDAVEYIKGHADGTTSSGDYEASPLYEIEYKGELSFSNKKII